MILERRRLERLEPVLLVDVADDAPMTYARVGGSRQEEVAGPAWWFG